MEVEEFLKEAAVMKEIKHPNLVQLLGLYRKYSKLFALDCPRFKVWSFRMLFLLLECLLYCFVRCLHTGAPLLHCHRVHVLWELAGLSSRV